MNGIYRYKNNQPVNWFNRSQTKSNQYCLYCGRFVGDGADVSSNKEHLIGREFVPTGEFGSGKLFNFIFRACEECNCAKSNVERHISSITLFNSPARRSLQVYNDLALRKAKKDYHPTKQGTLVEDSCDEFNITTQFGSANISFGFSSPPQAYLKYIEFLAFKHIQGIFSLITSKNPLTADGTTLLNHKYFFFFSAYGYSDWGNPHLLVIMERAHKIPCYANITTANGFFKAIMRREKGDLGEWFWALEWNKYIRIVGAIAQSDKTPALFDGLPSLDWKDFGIQDGARTRIREELPLDSEQDILFFGEVENTQSA